MFDVIALAKYAAELPKNIQRGRAGRLFKSHNMAKQLAAAGSNQSTSSAFAYPKGTKV